MGAPLDEATAPLADRRSVRADPGDHRGVVEPCGSPEPGAPRALEALGRLPAPAPGRQRSWDGPRRTVDPGVFPCRDHPLSVLGRALSRWCERTQREAGVEGPAVHRFLPEDFKAQAGRVLSLTYLAELVVFATPDALRLLVRVSAALLGAVPGAAAGPTTDDVRPRASPDRPSTVPPIRRHGPPAAAPSDPGRRRARWAS